MAHPIEKKARNDQELFQEMIPFLWYAAIPILITIGIALTFGTSAQ
jgi:hypothetical protein